jgi:hypothetical protein
LLELAEEERARIEEMERKMAAEEAERNLILEMKRATSIFQALSRS